MAKRKTEVRKRPKQERAQASVDAIVTAAARVLETDGLARLTTARIAEIAGVSVGTLYQYFPSKEAILGTLLERRFDDLIALVRGLLDATRALPTARAIRCIMEGLGENQQHVEAALHAPFFDSHSPTGRAEQFRKYLARIVALVAEHLELRRAELRVTDYQTAAFLLVHCTQGVAQGQAFTPQAHERLVRESVAIVSRYLLAESDA